MLLALQVVGLIFLEPAARADAVVDGADRKAARIAEPPVELFAFAETGNVLVLVLDAFQSDVFAEILEAERATFDRDFDGFVFFPDHAGAFPTTRFSMPAMLSGVAYRNDVPAAGYLADALGASSLQTTLLGAGYEVDFVSINRPIVRAAAATHRWAIPRPYVPPRAHRRFAAAQLLDLALFRQLPHVAKPWIYNRQAWRFQARFDLAARSFQAPNSRAVLDDLTRRATVGRRGPLAKIVHVGGAHLPVVLDAECRPTDGVQRGDRASYRAQARCTLRPVAALLERLRELGVYRDSLIVITSDHGVFLRPSGLQGSDDELGDLAPIVGQAMPLLMIKAPASEGPLAVRAAPSAITDLPATVCDLLGVDHDFPGEPILELAANGADAGARRRSFGYYRWSPQDWRDRHLHALHQYRIEGPIDDAASWSYRHSILSPERKALDPTLDLASDGVRGQLGPGWHRAASEHGGRRGWWVVAEEAFLFTSLDPGPLELRARLQSLRRFSVEVLVDGIEAGAARLDVGSGTLALAIPAGTRPAVSTVRLRFLDAGDAGVRRSPPGARIFFESISFEPVSFEP